MTKDEQWLLAEKYKGEKTEGFFTDCERLHTGEPLGYVIGYVPFLNCKIYLSGETDLIPPISSSKRHRKFLSGDRTGISVKKFTLIPRTETEYWVEKAISAIKQQAHRLEAESLGRQRQDDEPAAPVKLLDLCAGSGAIGVAVAKAVPEAHVTFGEIDKAHLPTIGKNLEANEISCTRYQVFQSNLFENISGQFDFILTNPPYIDPKIDRAEKSVKDFEPPLALYGGNNGMEIISKIISQAEHFLKPGGQLWIEHEPEQTSEISLLAHEFGFAPTSYQDQYQTIRYSVLMVQ